ncbi:MAG: phage tail spike protein [Lachnospirales bacterium]
MKIIVYNKQMIKQCYWNKFISFSYTLAMNNVSYGSFSIPFDMDINKEIQPFYFLEIYDNNNYVGMFRINSISLEREQGGFYHYEFEHAITTLGDEVLFGYHYYERNKQNTKTLINSLLSKQKTKHWTIGNIDFTESFGYRFENESLLSAIFSLPRIFANEYLWLYDTTSYPFKLHLKKVNKTPKNEFRYGANLQSINREISYDDIVTRIYPLGYGEGDNQLNIKSVNGGKGYLDKNVAQYGLREYVLVDRRFKIPHSLLNYGKTVLDKLSSPIASYKITALDIFRYSNKSPLSCGEYIRAIDKVLAMDLVLPIKSITKKDVIKNPLEIEIEVGSFYGNISTYLDEVKKRIDTEVTYSQGATNQFMINYADNCDNKFPAKLKFYLPNNVDRVNLCLLHFELEPFRAYNKSILGGGGQILSQINTTSSGASSTSTTSTQPTKTSGSSSTSTTSSNDSYTSNSSSINTTSTNSEGARWRLGSSSTAMMDSAGSPPHIHGLSDHYHPHSHSIAHYHVIGGHRHDMNHTHQIPSHNHQMPHTHNIAHTHTVPNHVHGIEFGIFEGQTATSITLKVDGVTVPSSNITTSGQIDIVPYLKKDIEGRIERDRVHCIEVVPNKQTRLVAEVFMQVFTNSYGGGEY